jgi:hypothetical protein
MKYIPILGVVMLGLVLSGCAENAGLLPPDALYPSILTTCQDAPKVDVRADPTKPRTAREKAELTIGLYGAYSDCKMTVAGWAKERALYVNQYELQHYGFFTRVWRAVTDAKASD